MEYLLVKYCRSLIYSCRDTFNRCTALKSACFPLAQSIGKEAFIYYTTLTITIGSAAPAVSINIFGAITATKLVTVKVLSGELPAILKALLIQRLTTGVMPSGARAGTEAVTKVERYTSYINLSFVYE